MKPPFRLIHNHHSDDVVETLEHLLQEARDGKVIGLAYGVMLKRRACFVDAAGEAKRNPLFALGVVQMLAGELIQRARGE